MSRPVRFVTRRRKHHEQNGNQKHYSVLCTTNEYAPQLSNGLRCKHQVTLTAFTSRMVTAEILVARPIDMNLPKANIPQNDAVRWTPCRAFIPFTYRTAYEKMYEANTACVRDRERKQDLIGLIPFQCTVSNRTRRWGVAARQYSTHT